MIKLLTSTLLGTLLGAFFIMNAWSLPDDPPGKAIFKANKCSSCHAVKSQGIVKGGGEESEGKNAPDLSGVGIKHPQDWMSKYLLKKETIDDKKHLKKFKGPDEDLETLTGWLATLKSK